jgi:hypothetical protein
MALAAAPSRGILVPLLGDLGQCEQVGSGEPNPVVDLVEIAVDMAHAEPNASVTISGTPWFVRLFDS